jgi:uncharacterized protein YjiS (DUF1127 family)
MAQLTRPLGQFAERQPLGRKVADLTRQAWSGYWTRRAERATAAILQSLDDRTLKDIGLDRSEIDSVVYSSRPGERRICWEPASGFSGRC